MMWNKVIKKYVKRIPSLTEVQVYNGVNGNVMCPVPIRQPTKPYWLQVQYNGGARAIEFLEADSPITYTAFTFKTTGNFNHWIYLWSNGYYVQNQYLNQPAGDIMGGASNYTPLAANHNIVYDYGGVLDGTTWFAANWVSGWQEVSQGWVKRKNTSFVGSMSLPSNFESSKPAPDAGYPYEVVSAIESGGQSYYCITRFQDVDGIYVDNAVITGKSSFAKNGVVNIKQYTTQQTGQWQLTQYTYISNINPLQFAAPMHNIVSSNFRLIYTDTYNVIGGNGVIDGFSPIRSPSKAYWVQARWSSSGLTGNDFFLESDSPFFMTTTTLARLTNTAETTLYIYVNGQFYRQSTHSPNTRFGVPDGYNVIGSNHDITDATTVGIYFNANHLLISGWQQLKTGWAKQSL